MAEQLGPVDPEFRDTIHRIKEWSNSSEGRPELLIPICDGVAYGFGHLNLAPADTSITVHLNDDVFCYCSPEDAIGVVQRRNWVQGSDDSGSQEVETHEGSIASQDHETSTSSAPTSSDRVLELNEDEKKARDEIDDRLWPEDDDGKAGADGEHGGEEGDGGENTDATIANEGSRQNHEEPKTNDGDDEIIGTKCANVEVSSKKVVEAPKGDDGVASGGEEEEEEEEAVQLFEIEEYIDEDGNETSSRLVDMRKKIEATEKFTSVLLKEMKQREDDARKDEDEDEEKGQSSTSVSKTSTSSEESRAVLEQGPLKGVGQTKETRSKKAKKTRKVKNAAEEEEEVEGADTSRTEPATHEELQQMLEKLAMLEEKDDERRAENAVSQRSLQSSAWSKGFLSGGGKGGSAGKNRVKAGSKKVISDPAKKESGKTAQATAPPRHQKVQQQPLPSKPPLTSKEAGASPFGANAVRERPLGVTEAPKEISESASPGIESSRPISKFKARRLQQQQQQQQQQHG